MLKPGTSYRIVENITFLEPHRLFVGVFLEYKLVDGESLAVFELSDGRTANLYTPIWNFEELSKLEAELW